MVLLLGLDRNLWGNQKLPLALGAFGVPGCTLYQSVEFYLPMQTTQSTARWTVTIPAQAALVDARFYTQALVRDPAANGIEATLSNSAEARIGTN